MSPVPLALRVSPLVPATAFFDPARARQVLTNGLTNAAKLSSKVPILVLAYPVNDDDTAPGPRGAVTRNSQASASAASVSPKAVEGPTQATRPMAPGPAPGPLPAGAGAGASGGAAVQSVGSSASDDTMGGSSAGEGGGRRYVCIQVRCRV